MFTYSTTFLQDNPNLKIWKIDFFDSPKIFENVKKLVLNTTLTAWINQAAWL